MLLIKRNILNQFNKVKFHCMMIHHNIETIQIPKNVDKIVSSDFSKTNLNPIKCSLQTPSEVEATPRINEMNIQMLSKDIYNHVFKNVEHEEIDVNLIEQCKHALHKHGMMKDSSLMEDVNFVIPEFQGNNIEEHFWNIGQEQIKPYQDIINVLLMEIPPIPEIWVMQLGWTRYAPNCPPESVDYPLEDGLVFDVEVCMNSGKAPTLATAVSNKAWYGWLSQSLLNGSSKPVTSHQYFQDVLIPLESNNKVHGYKLNSNLRKPKIIVGHNVSYDRSKIKEQYWLERTGMRFIDTMSLHICVSGVTSYQRAILKSGQDTIEDESWVNSSSLNSLSDVYKLYCGGSVGKETRDIFVNGTLSEIKKEFHSVMMYCANDVLATYNVLKILYPMFIERFPHPVTLAGMLELGTAYLPMNLTWNKYISNSEQTYEDLEKESRILLARRADQACQLLHDDKYKEDVWMWDLDWDIKNLRIKKSKKKIETKYVEENICNDDKQFIYSNLIDTKLDFDELERKFASLLKTRELLFSVKTLLPGYPNWYRKLCTKPNLTPDWIPGPHLISTSMQVTPKLLSLTWEGYPLHFIRGLGWGLLVPFSSDIDLAIKLPLQQLLLKCPSPSLKPDQMYSKWQAFEIAKAHRKTVDDMFTNPKWIGGTESAMFNRLEQIARQSSPVTPFLYGRLSRALEPQSMSVDRFLPTRVNWVVQSGAVDFLHLMLVCMRWLLGNRARFCLSFHDEIRYLVPEKYKYQAALAMHVTNLLTRAFCAVRLGLNDLPQSVSFFSSVEIDTVLRKEAKHDCKTPSNPHGLEKGYGVPNGESLDIYKAVEKANGMSTNWYKERNVQGYKT